MAAVVLTPLQCIPYMYVGQILRYVCELEFGMALQYDKCGMLKYVYK